MSATKTRITRSIARQVANKLFDHLEPACERIQVAGSLRRESPDVGDIELVCIPKMERFGEQMDLFGGVSGGQERSQLDGVLNRLVERHAIQREVPPGWTSQPAWGDKLKRFWLLGSQAIGYVQIDLNITTPSNWGWKLVIATGSGDFNKVLVAHFLRHTPYRQQAGALIVEATGEVVPVPEEETYFRLAGLPFIEPPYRTSQHLRALLRSKFQRLANQPDRSGQTTVANVRDLPPDWRQDPHYVYIGRKNRGYGLPDSKWLNPFVVGVDGSREGVIRLYGEYLDSRPELIAALPELRGKVLVCWCRPQACHGDELARRVNALPPGIVYTTDEEIRAQIRARLEHPDMRIWGHAE